MFEIGHVKSNWSVLRHVWCVLGIFVLVGSCLKVELSWIESCVSKME